MKKKPFPPRKRLPKPVTYSQQYRVKTQMGLLDFLLTNVEGMSRNNIKNLLKRRVIAVDGAPIAQFDFQVYPGDIVMIGNERLEHRNPTKIDVIYEDEELLAINKPSGLLSIASDKEKAVTAYRQVTDYVRLQDPLARVFVVHLIDMDTSGVLLFSKSDELRKKLQDQWNDLVIKRGYYALVAGVPKENEATLRHYLKETSTHLMYISDRQGDGQLATTHYQIERKNDTYALLNVDIESGRKNQIRVQLRHIGHPVVGDDKYDTLLNPINRLGLHAYFLSLKHPDTGKVYEFHASLPKEFVSVFKKKDAISKSEKPLTINRKVRIPRK